MSDSAQTTPAGIPQEQQGEKTPNISSNERAILTLAGSALALYGLSRRSPLSVALAIGGGYLAYRGARGKSGVYSVLGIQTEQDSAVQGNIHVENAFTVNAPVETLYQYWRDFSNLPKIIKNLDSVEVTDSTHSHWKVNAPVGNVEWDAEIVEDRPNELIAWKSLPNADIANAGQVRFQQLQHDRGTEVHVTLSYDSPAGALGAAVVKMFGKEPAQQVREGLRQFKSQMEAGERPTIEGQSSGRVKQTEQERSEVTKQNDEHTITVPAPDAPPDKPKVKKIDPVHQALEETFPASDPPANY